MQILFLPVIPTFLLADADSREGVEYSKHIAKPPQHSNDDHCVQNRLDGIRHGDELIDQPKYDADDD
jgi:hypothetical protein